ncbi:MAG: anti-sigma factor [candidate division Zixibacteria bacterium]|nr:anti-sigma factor [candidate division Zixibacteria bacterium]
MTHEQIRSLLEGYVFGSLDENEQKQVDAHLQTVCRDCRTELQDLYELSVKLAQSLPQSDPSPQLRENLLAQAARKSVKSSHRFPRRVWLPTSVSAAAAVALFFWGFLLHKENQKLRQRLSEAEDVSSLLRSPGMQFVDLKGVDPNPQAFGKVVLDRQRGKAVVYMYRLPQTPQGKQYQLWVMREGKPTSAGVFTVAPDGSAALKLDRLPGTDGLPSFLVTIEPEGGEAAPTGMMYLTGPVPPEKN